MQFVPQTFKKWENRATAKELTLSHGFAENMTL